MPFWLKRDFRSMPLLCPYCQQFEYEEGVGCVACTACTLLIHRIGEEGFTAEDHRWLGGELNRLLGEVSGRLLLRSSSHLRREEDRRAPRSRSPPIEVPRGVRLSEGPGSLVRPPKSRGREEGRHHSRRSPSHRGDQRRGRSSDEPSLGTPVRRRPPEPPAPPPGWRPSLRRPREEQPGGPQPSRSLKRAWDREATRERRSDPAREDDWHTESDALDLEAQPDSGEGGKGEPRARASSTSQEAKGKGAKGKSKGKPASQPKGGGKAKKKRNKGVKRIGWWQKYLERRGQKEDIAIEEENPDGTAEQTEEPPEEISEERTREGEAAVDERIERRADAEAAGGESES